MIEVSLQEVLRRANPSWSSYTVEYATQRLITNRSLPVRPSRREAQLTVEARCWIETKLQVDTEQNEE